MEIQISVRNLVEFILRSGNIDNRRAAFSENAMQEGGRIHRMIQRKMGADYHAEVFLRYFYETPDYTIRVEGRADGVMTEKNQEKGQTPGQRELRLLSGSDNGEEKEEAFDDEDTLTVTIDEIKGTYRDIHKMKAAVPVHLAQAQCYA
ncbi:MAG: hypothetical protein K2P50_15820, partial [Lachnospiraceae bacterium]|nr:hypothetical protein [Lachnospiraceae bacterium]